MTKVCERCGRSFEAQRRNARFCSSSCRARQSVDPRPVVRSGPVKRRRRRLQGRCLAALRAAGRDGGWEGALALELAEAIDAGAESGAALAALSREYAAAMARALADAAEADPVKVRSERAALKIAGLSDDRRAAAAG